jgi:hypothetical protein
MEIILLHANNEMYSRAFCQSIDDDGTRQSEGDVEIWHIIFDALVVILCKSLTSINDRFFFLNTGFGKFRLS